MQIKQSVVGTGAADKHQVQYMVRAMLELSQDIKPDHASDALAAAIDQAGPDKAQLFLVKLALLNANALGDAALVQQQIATALLDL